MKTKVSIIIPVYNTSSRLNISIKSALEQSIDSFEIIAINDGSTDDSLEILKAYQKANPEKIKVIDKNNGGAASARNEGIKAAKGDWIYFCDSDDLLDKDACKYLYERAVLNNAQISTCALVRAKQDMVVFGKETLNIACNGEQILNKEEVEKEWLLPLFRISESDKNKSHGYLVLALFNREIILQNNIRFDESIMVHQDESFYIQYLNYVNKAAISDKVLYTYIYFENSITSKFFIKKIDILKKEKGYYFLWKFRRLTFAKHFAEKKSELCTLFLTESFHRCIVEYLKNKNESLFARFSAVKEAAKQIKNEQEYEICKRGNLNCDRLKKIFFMCLRMGYFASFLFCTVAILRLKRIY